MNGDSDTFIRSLGKLIDENRKSRAGKMVLENTTFYQDIRTGKFSFNAFSNPNDPTKIITHKK
jgi:hypothetical protein